MRSFRLKLQGLYFPEVKGTDMLVIYTPGGYPSIKFNGIVKELTYLDPDRSVYIEGHGKIVTSRAYVDKWIMEWEVHKALRKVCKE